MASTDPFSYKLLKEQIHRQKDNAWDLETDISWDRGIDLSRYFLPLDDKNFGFSNISKEQRLALSQWMGLVINSTIAEMEEVIFKLKDCAWASILRNYSVNPEMWELGELFIEEEAKHSRAFSRYIDLFCKEVGVERYWINQYLPQAFGSLFQRATIKNAKAGGHAFWWVVAAVEEVSIAIYRSMQSFKGSLDPLFFELHLRHLEEEARHKNYAFLMLELIQNKRGGLFKLFHNKTSLILAQAFSSGWVISELSRFFELRKVKNVHPFFDALGSLSGHFEKIGPLKLMELLYSSAPYVSLVLNINCQPETKAMARTHSAWSLPMLSPKVNALTV